MNGHPYSLLCEYAAASWRHEGLKHAATHFFTQNVSQWVRVSLYRLRRRRRRQPWDIVCDYVLTCVHVCPNVPTAIQRPRTQYSYTIQFSHTIVLYIVLYGLCSHKLWTGPIWIVVRWSDWLTYCNIDCKWTLYTFILIYIYIYKLDWMAKRKDLRSILLFWRFLFVIWMTNNNVVAQTNNIQKATTNTRMDDERGIEGRNIYIFFLAVYVLYIKS